MDFPGIPKCYNCNVSNCDAERGSIKCRQNINKHRFQKQETPQEDIQGTEKLPQNFSGITGINNA